MAVIYSLFDIFLSNLTDFYNIKLPHVLLVFNAALNTYFTYLDLLIYILDKVVD